MARLNFSYAWFVFDEGPVTYYSLSDAVEDYVKAIHVLERGAGGAVGTSTLAARLDVTPGPGMPEGARGRFVRVSDSDPGMLRYLGERGIAPGDRFEVVERQPFGGPLHVRFGADVHALGGLLAVAALMLVAAVLAGCGASGDGDAAASEIAERKVEVTTTTNFITDTVRRIGGDRVEVKGLMGPGVDPHLYKASAGDVSTLRDADLIVYLRPGERHRHVVPAPARSTSSRWHGDRPIRAPAHLAERLRDAETVYGTLTRDPTTAARISRELESGLQRRLRNESGRTGTRAGFRAPSPRRSSPRSSEPRRSRA